MAHFLVITQGSADCPPATLELTEARLVLGRHVTADVLILDRSVNKYHADLELRDDGYWIADRASRNGTYVNEMRITEFTRLQPQDRIRVGAIELVYQQADSESHNDFGRSDEASSIQPIQPPPQSAIPTKSLDRPKVRSMRTRYLALAQWTAIACLMAGLFGAVHNQVSYTVSPDYFHAFKFIQFQITPPLHNRAGAALVGFLAAWWTGIFIGPVLTIVCGRVCDHRWPRAVMGTAIAATVLVTAAVGLVSLSAACLLVTPETDLSQLWIPRECRDPVAFTRAGIMHDGSYLGGAIGTIVGCLVAIRRGRRWRLNDPNMMPGIVSGEGQR